MLSSSNIKDRVGFGNKTESSNNKVLRRRARRAEGCVEGERRQGISRGTARCKFRKRFGKWKFYDQAPRTPFLGVCKGKIVDGEGCFVLRQSRVPQEFTISDHYRHTVAHSKKGYRFHTRQILKKIKFLHMKEIDKQKKKKELK